MKLKQTTAVDMTGVVNASPRRAASHSPATTSPRRQSPGGSGKSVINSSNNNISSTYISHSVRNQCEQLLCASDSIATYGTIKICFD